MGVTEQAIRLEDQHGSHKVRDPANQAVQVGRFQTLRFAPCRSQEALHRHDEPLDLPVDGDKSLAIKFRQSETARQELQVQRDGVQRRPDLVGDFGRKLSHRGEPLRTPQLSLEVEEELVGPVECLVAFGQLARGFRNPSLELLVKAVDPVHEQGVLRVALPDAPQHPHEPLGKLPHLVVPRDRGGRRQIPSLHRGHGLEQQPDGSVDAPFREEGEGNDDSCACPNKDKQELLQKAAGQPLRPLL